jgi:hypothetical protein
MDQRAVTVWNVHILEPCVVAAAASTASRSDRKTTKILSKLNNPWSRSKFRSICDQSRGVLTKTTHIHISSIQFTHGECYGMPKPFISPLDLYYNYNNNVSTYLTTLSPLIPTPVGLTRSPLDSPSISASCESALRLGLGSCTGAVFSTVV